MVLDQKRSVRNLIIVRYLEILLKMGSFDSWRESDLQTPGCLFEMQIRNKAYQTVFVLQYLG